MTDIPAPPVTYDKRDYALIPMPRNPRGFLRCLVVNAQHFHGKLLVHVRERIATDPKPGKTPYWHYGRGYNFRPIVVDDMGESVNVLDAVINGLLLLRDDFQKGLLVDEYEPADEPEEPEQSDDSAVTGVS